MYQIPPWVKGADTTAAYSRGYGLGQQGGEVAARLQMEQNRLAHQAQVTGIEIQLKQQQLERESIQKQQELEVAKHYHDEVTALKTQEIAQAEEKIQAQAQAAAQRSQAFLSYQRAITPKENGGLGMDPTQAMLMFGPGMAAHSETAASIRAINQPKPMIPADVKGFSILDPESNLPIPGMVGFPSASGRGMDVRNKPPITTGDITPAKAGDILKNMYQLQATPGIDTNRLNAMVPSLQAIMESGLAKKKVDRVVSQAPISLEGKKKEDLVSGQTYQTARGPAVWDGSVFKPIVAAQDDEQPSDQLDSTAPGQTAQNAPIDDSEESTDETE